MCYVNAKQYARHCKERQWFWLPAFNHAFNQANQKNHSSDNGCSVIPSEAEGNVTPSEAEGNVILSEAEGNLIKKSTLPTIVC